MIYVCNICVNVHLSTDLQSMTSANATKSGGGKQEQETKEEDACTPSSICFDQNKAAWLDPYHLLLPIHAPPHAKNDTNSDEELGEDETEKYRYCRGVVLHGSSGNVARLYPNLPLAPSETNDPSVQTHVSYPNIIGDNLSVTAQGGNDDDAEEEEEEAQEEGEEQTNQNTRDYAARLYPNQQLPSSSTENDMDVQVDPSLIDSRFIAECFSVTAQGGVLRSDKTEVKGFVPAGSVCDNNNSVTIAVCRSTAREELPKLSSAQTLVSDVFHFLPHAVTFNQFLVMWFPLNARSRMSRNGAREVTIRRVKVMYSPTTLGMRPEWRELDSSGEELVSAAVVSERVCLRLKHFCMFCAVEEAVPARFLFLQIFARHERSFMKITCQFADRRSVGTDLVRLGVFLFGVGCNCCLSVH